MRRSDQRRDAVFALYQHEVADQALDAALAGAKPFTRELAEGVIANRGALDAEIDAHSRGWAIDRIAPLEKNIMRVALFELHHRDDIPTEVTLNEAVNLAKRFCGTDAPKFVNGVLGAAARAGVGGEA